MTMKLPASSKTAGLVLCTLAYVVAGLAALAAFHLVPAGAHPLWKLAAADVAATVAVFVFSVLLDNSSVYDPYWSVAPVPIALYLGFAGTEAGAPGLRVVLVIGLVCAWAARLTFNWVRQWRGLGHEDWRYVDIRRSSGRGYWAVSFVGIHLMPTVMVFLGCLSLWPALTSGQPFGALDVAAAAVTAAAIWIEATADAQLRRFVTSRAPGDLLSEGLWAWSRHPNYFGEVLFWWGLFLFAVAADPASWWALAGPLAITALFLFISIPMIDRHMMRSRPDYAEVMQRRSRLVPWFPR